MGGGLFQTSLQPEVIPLHFECGLLKPLHYNLLKCLCGFAKVGVALSILAMLCNPISTHS